MARALWTGTISFGLVNIPVKLYRATATASGRSIAFHLLHDRCGSRIKNLRWCPHCEEAVEWSHLVKGYEVSKGRYVKVGPEELDEILPDEDFAAVAIEGFMALDEIDPLYCDHTYYAAPEGSPKAYVLLTSALAESGRVALARVILRTRSHLAMLRPHDGHLLLTTLFYEDEIVPAAEVPVPADPLADKRQLETALQLIESMTLKWQPSNYKDEYAAKVEALVEKKLAGGEVTGEPPEPPAGEVVDLMEALKLSIAQHPKKRAARKRPHRKAG